ncbi:MAG: hypothetical protein QM770_01190 [Tepidisphaeraceae bacterium]
MAIFVDANALGPVQDGGTWNTAYTTLQAALATGTSGDIWIADGTYKPGSNRTDAFELQYGWKLTGGFRGYVAGNGSNQTSDERDIAVYPTILSGDIGTVGNSADNSYHVLTTASNASDSQAGRLDGLTITGGNANGTGTDGYGGALYSAALPYTFDCTFTGNNAVLGGAVYNYEVHSTVWNINVTRTTFSNNTATAGGAIWSYDTDTAFSYCTFSNNTATAGAGGAIYQQVMSIVLAENSLFFGNSASTAGGAIYSNGSIVEANNTSFQGNSCGTSGGAICHTGSFLGYPAKMLSSSFVGNTSGGSGSALTVSSGTGAQVINCTFTANNGAGANGGAIYALNNNAITVENSILWHDVGGEISLASGSTASVNYSDVEGGYSGTNNVNADPLFVEAPELTSTFKHYGNLELRLGSPVVDQGNNAYIASGTSQHNVGITSDIVGQTFNGTRIFTQGSSSGTVDMGAYEQLINNRVGTATSWSAAATWDLPNPLYGQPGQPATRIPNQYDVVQIGTGATVQVGSGAFNVGQLNSASGLQNPLWRNAQDVRGHAHYGRPWHRERRLAGYSAVHHENQLQH